ncbi:hypothetical protein BDQ17DRAFT_1436293 [Cyathus striatus]|nr:hypothetical protein BDQ17DRAFT_1436293 [Cyathus striatus]
MPPGIQNTDPTGGPPASGAPPAVTSNHTSPPPIPSQTTSVGTKTRVKATGTLKPHFKSPKTACIFLSMNQYWSLDGGHLSPQTASALLIQISAVLPKTPKVPIDAIHAIATILQHKDWDHTAFTVASRMATHYTLYRSLHSRHQHLQQSHAAATKTMHLTKTNTPQDSNTTDFMAPSYASVAATFKVRLPPADQSSKHALANLSLQELITKANLALDQMEMAATNRPQHMEFFMACLSSTSVILELNSQTSANWLKQHNTAALFTGYFDGTCSPNLSLFDTIAEFVPVSFVPNVLSVVAVEEKSNLETGAISELQSLKPPEHHWKGQRFAHFSVSSRTGTRPIMLLGTAWWWLEDTYWSATNCTWAPASNAIPWGVDPAAWTSVAEAPPPAPQRATRQPLCSFPLATPQLLQLIHSQLVRLLKALYPCKLPPTPSPYPLQVNWPPLNLPTKAAHKLPPPLIPNGRWGNLLDWMTILPPSAPLPY